MLRIVLATNNRDKVREIEQIFAIPDIKLLSLVDFPGAKPVEEDGNTLVENALKKAREISVFTGLPAIADDTGLEVDALGGRPGVYSSRYAGEGATYAQNIEKLLRELTQIPDSQRTARFRCVAAFFSPKLQMTEEGALKGVILRERRGESGFGYDPIFFLPELNKSLAEMTMDEKNAISHRGQAFRRLAQRLQTQMNFLKENQSH